MNAARSTGARRNSSACPVEPQAIDDAIDDALDEHPDNGDVMSAVVLEADAKKIWPSARTAKPSRSPATASSRHSRACLTRRRQHQDSPRRRDPGGANAKRAPGRSPSCRKSKAPLWRLTRATAPSRRWWAVLTLKRTSSTTSPRPGANRARASSPSFIQPHWKKASRPRPWSTMAPLFFDAGVTGGQPWEPKNYDGKFEGPMTHAPRPGQVQEHDLDPDTANRGSRRTRRTGSPTLALMPTNTRPT